MSFMNHHASWGSFKARFLLTAAAAVMLSACSNAVERFSENPSDADPVYTASVQKQKPAEPSYQAPDEGSISSSPLKNASVQQPPKYDYTRSYQQKQPTYQPPAYKQPEVARVAPPRAPAAAGTVQVGPGMTLYSIARANNLTVAQLAAANNIKPPYAVRTGQTLRIPGAASPSLPQTTARATAPAPQPPRQQTAAVVQPVRASAKGMHTVTRGETLFSLGRKYGVSPYAIADANGLGHNAQLSLGQTVKIPSGGKALTARVEDSPPKLTAPSAPKPVAEMPQTDQVEAAPSTMAAEGAPQPEAQPQTLADNSASGMRWPVRGKVISGFGPKSNGLKNEGINISVPEGTSIRAAESGVVAYAGNELKGYGNLVLIRHEGGYVTAYAHAKELFVKRGDTVKRGDVIAKAGQTGSVSSPQLHFEVRKGATALDPIKYLSSSTASN